MENEKNDGTNPPVAPKSDINELINKYPRSAAYIKAENWKMSANYSKSIYGEKACNRIINEENYENVIKEMEKEWSDYCERNMWD